MEPKSWVKAGEHGWIDLNGDKAVFENISEGLYGEDVISFYHKDDSEEILYESCVYLGHSQPC